MYTLSWKRYSLMAVASCIPLTLFILTRLSNLLLLPVVTHAPLNYLHFYWGLPYNRAALVHAVLLTVLVVTLLFLLPTFLISAIEPDWSLLDALFFCFVTLSTVGQGGSSLGRSWGPAAKETLELLITCNYNDYLLVTVLLLWVMEIFYHLRQLRNNTVDAVKIDEILHRHALTSVAYCNTVISVCSSHCVFIFWKEAICANEHLTAATG
uniref:Potassium channel domain-containing protein n=1 Tax=Acanthochromis polyacanthus TaxID=80966 RepID=A0A3Q1EL85_9TELE